jgi:hypothetical protein
MASQWDNFLRNVGEWRGSFTSLTAEGELRESTPSILSLEAVAGERLVIFRLRRFGPEGYAGEPTRDIQQEYRSLGRQVVFFDSGCFAKGSLQLAPGTATGGEFGFLDGDRRHRLVQLFDTGGAFTGLVLIREFRAGSQAVERPPLEADQLLGTWCGQASTITADWPEPEVSDCRIEIRATADGGLRLATRIGEAWIESPATAGSERLLLLPDAGWSLVPLQVSHRAPATLEAGWLPAPDRLVRLTRNSDASGAWRSSTQITASRQSH